MVFHVSYTLFLTLLDSARSRESSGPVKENIQNGKLPVSEQSGEMEIGFSVFPLQADPVTDMIPFRSLSEILKSVLIFKRFTAEYCIHIRSRHRGAS